MPLLRSAMPDSAGPKYLSARELSERTGYSVRFFQDLAASGVPWVIQPQPRGRLFFEAAGFEAWWQNGAASNRKPREKLRPWRQSTRGVNGIGVRSKGMESPIGSHLEQKIQTLLKLGSQPESRNSTPQKASSEENGR